MRAEQASLREAHAHLKKQRQELRASQKQLTRERDELDEADEGGR